MEHSPDNDKNIVSRDSSGIPPENLPKEVLDKIVKKTPFFPSPFFSKKDSIYHDRLVLDLIKISGVNFNYYVKTDSGFRNNGILPGSTKEGLSPFVPRGLVADSLYGENLSVGERIDSITREVKPDWGFRDPFQFRGIVFRPETSYEPNEKGSILTRKLQMHLSRKQCEEINLIPEVGDVVELNEALNGFFDVEFVKTDNHRFGPNGFYTAFELSLKVNSFFNPERKIKV